MEKKKREVITYIVMIHGLKCLRCGHTWKQRSKSMPKVCPKCKSPWWNVQPKNSKANYAHMHLRKENEKG